MATQAELIAKRERVEALRLEIAEYKNKQAVRSADATSDYRLESLDKEEQNLAAQLATLRAADDEAAQVEAFNSLSQEEKDAEAFRAGKAAEEAATAAAVAAVIDAPKDELLEQAKALDIQGRSSMNKEELAEAIAEATTGNKE